MLDEPLNINDDNREWCQSDQNEVKVAISMLKSSNAADPTKREILGAEHTPSHM